ncbi:MAG: hypothetical protein ACOZQL_00440 [Myxococcota bacterium]
MSPHLTDTDAAQWIAGTLAPPEADALEAHARTCTTCEALLQHEARVEALLGVAARQSVVRPLRPRARWVALPLTALAAALALLLLRPDLPASTAADAGVTASLPEVPAGDETHFDGEAPPPEAFQARAPFSL